MVERRIETSIEINALAARSGNDRGLPTEAAYPSSSRFCSLYCTSVISPRAKRSLRIWGVLSSPRMKQHIAEYSAATQNTVATIINKDQGSHMTRLRSVALDRYSNRPGRSLISIKRGQSKIQKGPVASERGHY